MRSFAVHPHHWLQGALWCVSPNQNARPHVKALELVVIHNISLPPGCFGGPEIQALFTNQLDPQAHPFFAQLEGLQVSAHLLIRRTGQVIQFVPFHRRAWHAGVSVYQGREACNDFSIGIEMEGTDERPYTQRQYRVLTQVLQALYRAYPQLPRTALVGHADIAPQRKTDPGPAFDWQYLHQLLQETT
nr:1,6-anhydro-N-acetylmuramyl-L-alanine amidase AmpD [Allopseudospirillum japonicum]